MKTRYGGLLELLVNFSEEERFLLRSSGIGHNIFFRAPIPPDITHPEKIKQMKADNFGLFFTRDLVGFATKTILGTWPDLIAADNAEAALRTKLEELAAQLARAGGTTETSVVYVTSLVASSSPGTMNAGSTPRSKR